MEKLPTLSKYRSRLRLILARSGTQARNPQLIQASSTRKLLSVMAVVCLNSSWGGCGTAKVASRRQISALPTSRPAVIYVADFDLDAANVKSEKGFLPAPPKLPGPLGDKLPPPPGAAKDPQKVARDVVETMSASLVKDLTKAGFIARRLTSTNSFPKDGWLVRGVFTDVNQGNQLQRSVIGFGLGKTDLQVNVKFDDLSQG